MRMALAPVASLWLLASSIAAAQAPGEWSHYGRDAGGSRFAPLTQIDTANVSRLARQSAYERLGLLFLDLHYRLNMVGLADPTSFPMPLTQQVLSDALGLSIVHVNRTLKQLRTDGLVERAHKRVILPDPEALARAVDHAIPPFAATRGGKGLPASAPRPTLAKLGS